MSIVLMGSTSGSVTLQEPAVAGTTVLTLPAVSGTLITTGSSGQSIPRAALPIGSVIQVFSITKTDTFTTNSYNTWVDVTGLSVNITPVSSSNDILVFAAINYSGSSASTGVALRCVRGSTVIGSSDTAGSRTSAFGGTEEIGTSGIYSQFGVPFIYLDSPITTSSTTYKIQANLIDNYGTLVINRTGYDGDTTAFPRSSSAITVMEIAA